MNKDYKKLYEDTLERAKYLKENTDSVGALDVNANFEYILPELSESEDERIRKEIIAIFKGEILYTSEEDAQKYIAWLEKQGEQKPSWSKEDEKLYISALWHIKNSCGNDGRDSGEYEVYNWLKSIKDRVHPKQELSEEDEKIINDAIWLIEHYVTDGHKKLLREQTIDKLKSLKPNH